MVRLKKCFVTVQQMPDLLDVYAQTTNNNLSRLIMENMSLLLFVCLFLHELTSNRPGINVAPTGFSFKCQCTQLTYYYFTISFPRQ